MPATLTKPKSVRPETDSPQTPELLFQNGFEGTSKVIPYDQSDHTIVGRDHTLPSHSDWTKDLRDGAGVGHFTLQYTGGDPSRRLAEIIPEPGNPSNNVLHFWIKEAWPASENQVKARVQANFYNWREGLDEFYQSVRVFLHEDFNKLRTFPQSIHWLTLAEFWNNAWWPKHEKFGFRVTFGLGKASDGEDDLVFHANAENPGQKEVWTTGLNGVKAPIGKWFTLDYYYKCGNQDTGRFYAAMTPDGGTKQVLMDVHNFTHCTFDPAPTPITDWNPLKLYTSKEVVAHVKNQGGTLQMYWDDLKLWKNKRP